MFIIANYGKHYYNNGISEVLIHEDVYENEFRDKGFVKGRLKSRLDTLHKNSSQRCKGCVYVHKDNITKRLNPKQLNEYLNNGWIRGKTPRT